MFDTSTPRGRIINSTLDLAATRSWPELTLLDIADAAGTTLVELRKEFSSKVDILGAFTRAVDDEVLKRAPKSRSAEAPRDRVFEVLMSRFDVLAPYKSALKHIWESGQPDSGLLKGFLQSQHWMLQAAGVPTDGVRGGLKVAGVASVYASVFRVWLEDDDPGLARTMAALDRRLRRGEGFMASFDEVNAAVDRVGAMFKRRRSKPAASDPTPDGAPSGSAGGASV